MRRLKIIATAIPAPETPLPPWALVCGVLVELEGKPCTGFAGDVVVGDTVSDVVEDDMDAALVDRTVVEVGMLLADVTLPEVVEDGVVSVEELVVVAATVGTTVTTCGLAEVVGSSCVIESGCGVVDAGIVDAAAVSCVLSLVVMPKMLSARLSMGENMSRT